MKRNALTTALLLGLAGAAGLASAAEAIPRPDGLGEVLIYPYYTVDADAGTFVHVVNTTERARAVKVRFIEGRTKAESVDFDLLLSANAPELMRLRI